MRKRSKRKRSNKRTNSLEKIFTEGTPSNHLGAAGKGGWAATKGYSKTKNEVYKNYPVAGDY
jgi:hypothetical protein